MCILRDEPISDISGPGYLALMRLSRQQGVPVLLMGQGGDELFWGYPWTIDAIRQNQRKMRLLEGRAGVFDYVGLSRPPMSLSHVKTRPARYQA
jgi:asparagine synthase (glutamine-hydrolysing)